MYYLVTKTNDDVACFKNIAPAMSLGVNYVLNCVNLPDPCGHTFELAISGYALCLANRKREAAVTMGKLWNCANVNLRMTQLGKSYRFFQSLYQCLFCRRSNC